eukprot:2912054-Pyramimonas_sp.AAC.1
MPLLPRTRTPEGDPRTEAQRGRVDRRPQWVDVERERNRKTGVNPIDRVEKRAQYHATRGRETPRI